jgi:hypothetical protein
VKPLYGLSLAFFAGILITAGIGYFAIMRPATSVLDKSIQSGLDHAAQLAGSLAAARADVERWKTLDAQDAALRDAARAEARRSDDLLSRARADNQRIGGQLEQAGQLAISLGSDTGSAVELYFKLGRLIGFLAGIYRPDLKGPDLSENSGPGNPG